MLTKYNEKITLKKRIEEIRYDDIYDWTKS